MQALYQHNHDNYMLMIACSGMAFGIGLRAAIMARGRRPRVIMGAQRSQFINWLLDFTLIPRFNQASMGFTRPLDFTRPL